MCWLTFSLIRCSLRVGLLEEILSYSSTVMFVAYSAVISDYNMPFSLLNIYYFNTLGGVKISMCGFNNHMHLHLSSFVCNFGPDHLLKWWSDSNAFRRAFTPGLFRIDSYPIIKNAWSDHVISPMLSTESNMSYVWSITQAQHNVMCSSKDKWH